jgi:hypothetical protein
MQIPRYFGAFIAIGTWIYLVGPVTQLLGQPIYEYRGTVTATVEQVPWDESWTTAYTNYVDATEPIGSTWVGEYSYAYTGVDTPAYTDGSQAAGIFAGTEQVNIPLPSEGLDFFYQTQSFFTVANGVVTDFWVDEVSGDANPISAGINGINGYFVTYEALPPNYVGYLVQTGGFEVGLMWGTAQLVQTVPDATSTLLLLALSMSVLVTAHVLVSRRYQPQ